MYKLSGWQDTIVALATPPGVGAIGVIRLSGQLAFPISDKIFPAKKISDQPTHTIHVGYLKDDKENLDEAVLSIFKGPKSYTGEDVVEVSCHGSSFILQKVIDVCVKNGARLAKPGEFTQRAFLNGKLDLAQAEAVADLIASNTAASQKAALHTMRGGFSDNLKHLREQLLQFSALIELELDFSQEDVEFADRTKFHTLVDELTVATNTLIQSFRLGNVIKNGVSIAIVGKPNAGKSTLLNTLLNENRAIVSDIPGTTRDTIEEIINIEGILFRLIDTAGIREHAADVIETAGIERSKEKIDQADLVIYLFDVNEDKTALDKQVAEFNSRNINYLLVANKIDEENNKPLLYESANAPAIISISAKTGLNVEKLKQQMVAAVLNGQLDTEATVVTNARHHQSLLQVAQSLSAIKNGLNNNLPSDLLALDIRHCLHYLGEITGEITNDDQLDYIFSKFCIGK
jgi:tRNA modification GTPase